MINIFAFCFFFSSLPLFLRRYRYIGVHDHQRLRYVRLYRQIVVARLAFIYFAAHPYTKYDFALGTRAPGTAFCHLNLLSFRRLEFFSPFHSHVYRRTYGTADAVAVDCHCRGYFWVAAYENQIKNISFWMALEEFCLCTADIQ